jgi:hypothetical protein
VAVASEAVDDRQPEVGWLTPGVRGIGTASLLADLGHEIPTALLPSFLTATLGAPAAALGIIEGVSEASPAPRALAVARSPTTRSDGAPQRSVGTPPQPFSPG